MAVVGARPSAGPSSPCLHMALSSPQTPSSLHPHPTPGSHELRTQSLPTHSILLIIFIRDYLLHYHPPRALGAHQSSSSVLIVTQSLGNLS